MRSRRRTIVIIAAGAIVLLLVVALALLHTPAAKRVAFEQVRKILEQQGIVIEAAGFDYGLLSLHISTGRISIRSASSADLPVVFTADGMSAYVSLFDLIRGRYRIIDSTLINPKIQIVVDEGGRNNIPQPAPTTTAPSKPADWLILKLRSTGGSLTFEDRSQGILVNIPAWELSIDGNGLTGTQQIKLTTSAANEVRYQDKRLTLESISAAVALKQQNQTLQIDEARLSSGVADIAIKGSIESLSDPVLDLAMTANMHLGPAAQYLALDQRIEGDLSLEGSAKGRLNQLKLAGVLKGQNLTVETIQQIALEANLSYDVAGQRAKVAAFQTRAPGVSVSGTADLALADSAGVSSVEARVDGVDIEKISSLLKAPITVASRATGNLSLNWSGVDLARMDGTGHLRLTALSPARNFRRIPLAGEINVNVRGRSAVATIASLGAGPVHLRGQVTLLETNRLGGTIRADIDDTGQALNQMAAWSGNAAPAGFRISGPANIDVRLDGTVERPRIAAILGSQGLAVNELKNISVDVAAEYTPTQVDVSRVVLKWEDESLTGSGRIGLTSRSPTLDATAEVANLSIQHVLQTLGRNDIPAGGILNLSAAVSGTVENPVTQLKMTVSDLEAYSEPLGTLAADANLQNQVVRLDVLKLTKPGGGDLQATGRYEIATGAYAVKADIVDLTANRVVLPSGTIVHGNLNGSVESSGSLENPNGTLRLTARDVQVDEEVLGTVDVAVNLANHQARLTVGAPSFGVTSEGSVGTASPYPLDVNVRVADLDVSKIPSVDLKALTGRFTANVNASGDLADINNLHVRAEVPNLKLEWQNHSITGDGPINAQYANRELIIPQTGIRIDDSVIRLSGNLPLDEARDGELKIEAAADLAALVDLIPSDTPLKATGKLALNGSMRGNLKRMDPEATITILEGSIETPSLPAPLLGLNLKITMKDGRAVLEQLGATLASAKISASGEVPFALLPDLPIEIPRPVTAARLTADIEGFKLSSLSQPPENTDGTISLRLEAEAAKPTLDLIQARLTFPELRVNTGPYSLEQVGTSTIEIRNGVASVQQFELRGPQTNIHLAGTADLRESGPIDLKLEGTTDAAVLALFNSSVKATGDTRINIAATGTSRQPNLTGFVELQNGETYIDEPRIAAENVRLRLELNGGEIKVTRVEGSLNGGSIRGEGGVILSGAQSGSSELTVWVDEVYLEFPVGVRTLSNAKLSLKGNPQQLTLAGTIDVLEGSYSDPLTLDRGLMRYLESESSTIAVAEEPSVLSRTRLDIGLRTLSPIVVDNNIARGNLNAELHVLGTVDQPGLTGRIDVEEGAEISLRERKYSVDRGVITFTNERAIEPILDIEATTKVSRYDITMQISGNATGKIDTVLTSEPVLSESDIISILATGRTLDSVSTSGAAVAKEQVLSYVAGELGTSITEGAGRALGLSEVRIEPDLIANEAEPTARLTIGKDITPDIGFVYSMNLRDSNDQIWIGKYDITRRFSTRGVRQNDNTYRFQFQHDLAFGLRGESGKSDTPGVKRKIGAVVFPRGTHLTEKQLRDASGLKTGKTYDFFSVQNARNRLEETFAKEGRLEARISADRTVQDTTVDLSFRLKEGPKIEFDFQGWNVSKDIKEEIQDIWSKGVIDAQRLADVKDLIENALVRDRRFGGSAEGSIEMADPDTKRVVFKIEPGIQYRSVRAAFEGIRDVEEEELQKLLKKIGFFESDLKQQKQAPTLIESFYRDRGYLDVKVEPPRSEANEESRTVRLVFRVTEGPLYRFGLVWFQGNAEFNESDLQSHFSAGAEDAFAFKTVQQTQQELLDLYRRKGYNDVVVQYTQVKDIPKKTVDVTFNIQEGYQRVFRNIDVEGNQKTSENLIRTQTGFKTGDIVSYDRVSQARGNLYDTRAYTFVEIVVEPLEDRGGVKPNQQAVRLIARVRELQPWQLRYGGFFDTERGPGGVIDLSNHNTLGGARVIGLQTRYDTDLHEARTYFSQPALRRFPLNSILSAFWRREITTGDDPDSEIDDFITDRIGFTPSFEYRLAKNSSITAGYRFVRTRTFLKIPDPTFPFDIPLRVAPLTSSFSRDTRDDPLDASRGQFTSHAFEWGVARLGSELRYVKYLGQYFKYLPFGEPSIVPWVHSTRNRLVVALGARVGLSKGLGGQEIIPSERFFAGGGTTVRGFDQDLLGPRNPLGAPAGGEGMTILNSEIRFPLFKFFDGVGFVDAGNVYRHLADFKPFDLRAAYGIGLRIRTPYIVVRLDYGFKIRPKPGEPRGKFFGSIGQAY